MGVEGISGVPYLVSLSVTLLTGTASVSVAIWGTRYSSPLRREKGTFQGLNQERAWSLLPFMGLCGHMA